MTALPPPSPLPPPDAMAPEPVQDSPDARVAAYSVPMADPRTWAFDHNKGADASSSDVAEDGPSAADLMAALKVGQRLAAPSVEPPAPGSGPAPAEPTPPRRRTSSGRPSGRLQQQFEGRLPTTRPPRRAQRPA
ncbi:MAG: hypothetical protein RL722_2492, partial [Pseudomonadota bacterium]